MFNGTLFEFQTKHEENLLQKCQQHEQLVLSAPTGSGKTILVSKFIDDYLDENPKTVFVWLCPGAGGLEKQSRKSFESFTSEIPYGDVYDFISESDPSGKVYFINWDKINKSSNTVLKEGEHKNLMERIAECHKAGIAIFMIVDEEHKFSDTTERFINLMTPKRVLRISATPKSNAGHVETILDEEVIAAGLICTNISINEGLSEAIQDNNLIDDDLLLVRLADEKRKAVLDMYSSMHAPIRPLVLIQFPNGSEEWIERVKAELADMGYTEKNGLVASWFSGDHPENVPEIKKLDGKYAFLLFKQAIATGWDCPRAKILVKLREGGTEAFNIQTIGRIRRMPERKHYQNELLDRCYVYTLDNEFSTGLTQSIAESFYSFLLKKKKDISFISLKKERLDGSDKYAINPEAVVKVLHDKFIDKYGNGSDHLDMHIMATVYGFVFGTKLKTSAFEGVARTTSDIKHLNVIFGGEHEISNHDDGFIIRDAKRRIARALGVEESISNNALRILFGPIDKYFNICTPEEEQFESDMKLLKGFTLREFNAFLINNRDLLIQLFVDISANEIAEIEETTILEEDWVVPSEQYYKMHKRIAARDNLDRNAFDDYKDNILVDPNRSFSERSLEYYCETDDKVDWIYKNGDKGSEFFSIVYRMAFGRANFYPDYIIRLKDGTVWIVEAKGGVSGDGTSKNIDQYAKNKFDSLAEYGSRHPELKWGFVRVVGSNLYLSNKNWTEDMSDANNWVRIEEFF